VKNIIYLSYKNDELLWRDFKNIENMIDVIITIANHEFSLIWKVGDDTKVRHYVHALSDYPNISEWELKRLMTFCNYEDRHNRKVAIWCSEQSIEERIKEALLNQVVFERVILPSKITECTACKQEGCLTKFLCHTASIENAISIIKGGSILSAVNARKLPAEILYNEPRNAAGDPLDYFEYVMLAFGNCQAGDRLVMERMLNRNPNEGDLSSGFKPGVRFYFEYDKLKSHPSATLDGFHPMKIKDELKLEDYLLSCIIPMEQKVDFENIVPEELQDRVFYIENDCRDIWEWSEKVFNFIEELKARNLEIYEKSDK